jgi:hypothetical protein
MTRYRTHDAHTGAHEYADKDARRVSRKVFKAVKYTVSDKAAKELKRVAYRLAYDEGYGPVYRDLLKREIESNVLDTVREAFDRFNAERDAVHITTFEEDAELVRQATEQDDADRLADLQERAS